MMHHAGMEGRIIQPVVTESRGQAAMPLDLGAATPHSTRGREQSAESKAQHQWIWHPDKRRRSINQSINQ